MPEFTYPRFFVEYLRSRRLPVIMTIAFMALILLVYRLYSLPWEATGYTLLLIGVISIIIVAIDCVHCLGRARTLYKLRNRFPLGDLPAASTPEEIEYVEIVTALEQARTEAVDQLEHQNKDASEYYTLWVHQIKTPIAAMRLLLQRDTGDELKDKVDVQQQLFKIEQYVEMALQYQRLSSIQADLSFERHNVAGMVKKAVKNMAPLFIHQKLPLQLEDIQGSFVTDEKWFVFVVEQLLSNAAKYTTAGYIRVFSQDERTLGIEDTGIGIRPEEIPLVFNRGFTGTAGRVDGRATGLGLYLCREITSRLGIEMRIESELGKGTTVWLIFHESELLFSD